ncbi:MbnP family protein [Limibacter armeniacum]|uniref:MbnP family protein n=1 Tax=Limibacter armeniacum TaxID=466084 RepID=UPI002FE6B215
MKILNVICLASLLLLLGCDKENEATKNVQLSIQLELLMDGAPLVLEEQHYTNALGETFEVSDFRFYLTNISLQGESSDAAFSESESYHLIAHDGMSNEASFTVSGIPSKQYDTITFAVGVDPDRNYSIDNTGDLDPNNAMAWNWNTGYKFVLLEGKYYPDGGEARGLAYHIGGDDNYRVVTLPAAMDLSKGDGTLKLKVNVDKIFGDKAEQSLPEASRKTTFITLERNGPEDTMFGPYTQLIANNYAQMFEVVQ